MSEYKNKTCIIFKQGSVYVNSNENAISPTVNKEEKVNKQITQYKIVITNPSNSTMENLLFINKSNVDRTIYLKESFKVNGVRTIPMTLHPIRHTIPYIEPNDSVTIEFDLLKY